ncbi:hypothetical protein [Proteiniphilum sp.]|uniref:hypothetical protein n=1 Tax=Proteiniphilum sp. TaxID=1926877 RepID=UPI002B21FE6A|nr:hypothetical protein [Proteiniphilum sp.]MEA4917393.1 hypothetical protein [Proteiniphilum sp.]
MKYNIILISLVALLITGCKKEEIFLYNTQNTPDLSNPIIQKMTNIVWYKDMTSISESWASQNNIYKPSDFVSSILYQAAWSTLTLYRDGTSNMLFIPPFVSSTVIHCKGNWQVSTTEENTIIMSTKTPVSIVTAKIKVLNMEVKDNVSIAKVSIDFGDRLITTDLVNKNPDDYSMKSPAYASAVDDNWFATQQIQTAPLKAENFIGAWASPGAIAYENTFSNEKFPLEGVQRVSYVEDLLANTPTFLNGVIFNLRSDGKAQIAYRHMMLHYYKDLLNTTKEVVSDAKWSVRGNKVYIETDEEYFSAIGEELFNVSPYADGLIYVSEDPRRHDFTNVPPVRIQPKQFYSMELISKTDKGFWTRITSKTAIFYVFMSKVEFDGNNTINIREAHQ